MKKTFLSFIVLLSITFSTYAQISEKWEAYYNANPSEISTKFQGIDFLYVARKFGFKPTRIEFKNNYALYEKVILNLSYSALDQFKVHGWYYSRTVKHDDWFYIYNQNYKSIQKDDWDKWCPYLIPLMSSDGTILLR